MKSRIVFGLLELLLLGVGTVAVIISAPASRELSLFIGYAAVTTVLGVANVIIPGRSSAALGAAAVLLVAGAMLHFLILERSFSMLVIVVLLQLFDQGSRTHPIGVSDASSERSDRLQE